MAAGIVIVVGAGILLVAGTHAAILARAARVASTAPAGGSCVAHAALGRADFARLVLGETVSTLGLAASALRLRNGPYGDPTTARVGVLLLGPAWLPRGGLSTLGRRLARGGVVVTLARVPRRPTPAALARIAHATETLGRGRAPLPLAIVCYDRAALAAPRLAALLPRRVLRRCVALAAPAGAARIPDAPVTAIRIALDPWITEEAGSPSPGGGIELSGVGHLGVLVAPHVADVVYDAAIDDDSPTGGGS